eukprot:Sspe_Gene.86705::Locus_57457_Transcript_2_3_Confidence_0.286_Length_6983::g.86705::m.86705
MMEIKLRTAGEKGSTFFQLRDAVIEKIEELDEEGSDDMVQIGERKFQGKSLRMLSVNNPVRWRCIQLIVHPLFDNTILVLILINAVFIGLDNPLEDNDSPMMKMAYITDIIFLAVFTGEVVVKVIAMGLVAGKGSYLRDAWNSVDFVIVVSGIIDFLFKGVGVLSLLRIIRVFRPLRSINRIAGMRRLVNTLFACLPLMLDIVFLSFLIFYLFSLIGVVLWHDSLHHRCWLHDPSLGGGSRGPDLTDRTTGNWGRVCGNTSMITAFHVDCPVHAECRPDAPSPYKYANFDHVGHALLLVFQCVTLDGWITHAYAIEDGWSPFASIFFIFLTMFGAYFFANLILAVVTDALSRFTADETTPLTAAALSKHGDGGSATTGTPRALSPTSSAGETEKERCFPDFDPKIDPIEGKGSDDAPSHERGGSSLRKKTSSRFDRAVLRGTQCYAQLGWKAFVDQVSRQAIEGLENYQLQRQQHQRKRSNTTDEHDHLSSTFPAPMQRSRNRRNTMVASPSQLMSRVASLSPRRKSEPQTPAAFREGTLKEWYSTVVAPNPRTERWKDIRKELDGRFHARAVRSATRSAAAAAATLVIAVVQPRVVLAVRNDSMRSLQSSTRSSQSQMSEAGVVMEPPPEGSWRYRLFMVCSSHKFTVGVATIVIINAIIMAIEHYNMPSNLSSLLELINFIITFAFTIETGLKIVSFGFRQWAKDRFNLFDGFIVLISLVELAFFESKAVSLFRVFRLFRVLRVLKLARNWKVLQKITEMISTSLAYIGYLILLILLFVFIFAVLGRALFAGKVTPPVWCADITNATACASVENCGWRPSPNMTCADGGCCRVEREWSKFDSTYRANFDELLWAAMHVFQVLTKDNWALLCYRLMLEVSPGSVAYFLTILILGTYLLFSMFVAILLVKLGEQDTRRALAEKEKKERRKRRQEQRLAVESPSTVPQGTPSPSPIPASGAQSPSARAGSPSVSRSEVILYQMQRSGERKERLAARKKMNYRQRRDSMSVASAGGMSNTSRSNTLPFTAFKRKLDTGCMSDDGSSVASFNRTGLVSALKGSRLRAESVPAQPRQLQILPPTANDVVTAKMDAIDELLNEARVDECFAEDEEDSSEDEGEIQGHSFRIFGVNHPLRYQLTNLVMARHFEVVVSYLIIANCLVITLNDNALHNDAKAILAVRIIDWVFTAIFTFEILMRCIVHGAVVGEHSYLRRHRWNKVDALIVLLSLIAVPIEIQARSLGSGHHKHVSTATRIIKAFRAFRPLRILVRTKRMKVVVGAFVRTIPAVFNVMAVAFVLYFVYGIAGVQLMQGLFRRCSDGSDRSKEECVGQWNATAKDGVWMTSEDLRLGYRLVDREWINPLGPNFDNLLNSWVTLLEVAGLSGWMDVMYTAIDGADEVDGMPKRNNRPLLALYFVSWIFAGAFFVMNIFTGVVVDHFTRQKLELDGSIFLTAEQELSLRVKRIIHNARAKKKRWLQENPTKINKFCYSVCTHHIFPRFILVCVVLNVILMATIHHNMDRTTEQLQTYGNLVFTIIFTIEMLLEVGVAGFKRYLSFKWFRLDCIIVVISWGEVLVARLLTGGSGAALIQLMRLGRAFRLLRHFKGLRKLLLTLYYSLPAFYNIGSLLLLMFFIFSLLGMALFEDVRVADSEELYPVMMSQLANFKNFPRSMVTLYRVATMDSWVRILGGCQIEEPYCSQEEGNCGNRITAAIFFTTFMICVGFVMMNLFIAIILENFRESVLLPDELNRKMEQVILFREMWASYDPHGLQFIHARQFVPLLQQLHPPLGLAGQPQRNILPHLRHLDFPITWPEQHVLFADAIDAIGESVFEIKLLDSILTRKYLRTHNRMDLYQYGFTVVQWLAAAVIQTSWRNYRLGQPITGSYKYTPPEEDELMKQVAAAVQRRRREKGTACPRSPRRPGRYPGESSFRIRHQTDRQSLKGKDSRLLQSYFKEYPELAKPPLPTTNSNETSPTSPRTQPGFGTPWQKKGGFIPVTTPPRTVEVTPIMLPNSQPTTLMFDQPPVKVRRGSPTAVLLVSLAASVAACTKYTASNPLWTSAQLRRPVISPFSNSNIHRPKLPSLATHSPSPSPSPSHRYNTEAKQPAPRAPSPSTAHNLGDLLHAMTSPTMYSPTELHEPLLKTQSTPGVSHSSSNPLVLQSKDTHKHPPLLTSSTPALLKPLPKPLPITTPTSSTTPDRPVKTTSFNNLDSLSPTLLSPLDLTLPQKASNQSRPSPQPHPEHTNPLAPGWAKRLPPKSSLPPPRRPTGKAVETAELWKAASHLVEQTRRNNRPYGTPL